MIEPKNKRQMIKMKIGFWKGKLKFNPTIRRQAEKEIGILEKNLADCREKEVFDNSYKKL